MRILCLSILLSSLLYAQIDISTGASSGYFRGSCVKAGPVYLSITSDLFPHATPETPVYLKVTLSDPGAKLCQTLVELDRPDLNHQPILLAIVGSTPYHSPAPGHAVSIVRWLKGERAFWLKITSPTSQWLSDGNQFVTPSESFPATIIFGMTIEELTTISDLHFYNRSNLRYPSTINERPISTEIRMDLTNSQLETSGLNISLSSWIELYDHTTSGVEEREQITLGVPIPFHRSGEAIIFLAYPNPIYEGKKLCPWVSWNDRYDSDLVLNNRDVAPCDLRLTLRRADGQSAQALLSLTSWQSQRIPIGELFPDWTRGSSASLEIEYTPTDLSASVITYLRNGCSGFSPAVSKAVQVSQSFNNPYMEAEDWGASLSFAHLVSDQNFFPAVVLLNLGNAPIDARLLFIAGDGSLRALDTAAAQGLEPMRPRAILLRDLFPTGELPQQLLVDSSDGKLCGLTFLFNNQGEPAMTPAVPYHLPNPLLLPKSLPSSR